MNPLVELVIRATVLLVVGLCLWALARHRSAESRVRLLRIVLAGLVILPALWAVGPQWTFDIPGMKKPAPITISLESDIQTLMAAAPVESAPKPIDYLPFVYGGIALLLLVPAGIGAVLLRRIWRKGDYLGWRLEDELDEALDTVGVKQSVEARLSDIPSPMVYGVIRRKLLLPQKFGDWQEEHRRLALLHEAAHLKRFDCAWQHLAYGVRAVYWCHPLVWFLSRALKDETELAADERAIRSGAEAADYASALVAIARTLQEPGRLVRSQGVTFMNHRQLDRRVVSVLHGNRRGFSSLASLALAGFVGLGTFLAAGSHPQQPQPEIQIAPAAAPSIAASPTKTLRLVPQSAPAIVSVPVLRQAKRSTAPTVSVRIQGGPATAIAPLPSRTVLIPAQENKSIKLAPIATPTAQAGAPALAPAPTERSSKAPKASVWLVPSASAPARVNGQVWVTPPASMPAKTTGTVWALPNTAVVAPAQAASPSSRPVTALKYRVAPQATEVKGVPILKDLPIIGQMFRTTPGVREVRVAPTYRTLKSTVGNQIAGASVAAESITTTQADDKATNDMIERIRHLHVDSDRDVDAIRAFLKASGQDVSSLDDQAVQGYWQEAKKLQLLGERRLAERDAALRNLEVGRATNLRSTAKLEAEKALTLQRDLFGKQRSLAASRELLNLRSTARTLTIDTQSKKPVTLKLMIDGKEQTIQATPDANGVVKITVDEKGNVKVIKN